MIVLIADLNLLYIYNVFFLLSLLKILPYANKHRYQTYINITLYGNNFDVLSLTIVCIYVFICMWYRFLGFLKWMLQNFQKILKRCFSVLHTSNNLCFIKSSTTQLCVTWCKMMTYIIDWVRFLLVHEAWSQIFPYKRLSL